jgi:CHRD domain
MTARRRALVAGAVSLAALLAVGAPLIAQSGPHDPPANGKGPVQTTPGDPGKHKGKPKVAPKNTTFFATLLGRNEIGTDGKRRAGDLDGQGGATVVTTDTQLCFAVAVRGIATPSAMHVHRGRPNENGGIEVSLVSPTSGDPGTSGGCVKVANTLLQEITKHPIRFYVNIHTSDFENGALRGQLHRAPRRR